MKNQHLFLVSLAVFLGAVGLEVVGSVASPPSLIGSSINPAVQPVMAQDDPIIPSLNPSSDNLGLLRQEDVPAEFRLLPSPIARSISDRLRVITRFFGQENFQLDRHSAFVNPADLQVILGFTGSLPNQSDQFNFDSKIQQLQQPQFQQQLLGMLRRSSLELSQVEFLDSQPLGNISGVGNSAAGVRMTVQFRNQVWRIDAVPFRRGGVRALAAVVYPRNVASPLAALEIARRLDSRIVENSLR